MSSLYIHIPFCEKKCAYCDFVSFDSASDRAGDYFRAIEKEIEISSGLYPVRGVSTVFFGGGTPSFVDEGYIESTLEAVRKRIGIKDGAEITLEANPNSLTKKKLEFYRQAGINRLSIGLQSADNALLLRIGRLHTAEMFARAYHQARDAGFRNINVDLIYALPGQTVKDFENTLCYVAAIAPDHISAYALTLSTGTPLHADIAAGRLAAPDEEEDREMYHLAADFLREEGYGRYEISNFAKKGYECAHNLAYWHRKDYLGLGAAAHSCVGEVRFSNTPDLGGYINCLSKGKTAYNSRESLDAKQVETETIMLSLRLEDGIEIKEYERLFGRDFNSFFAVAVKRLKDAGLAEVSGGRFYATDRGFDLQNSVVLELLKFL
jgi:oxygen-independent coproporphyrinogen-3 oxidase